MTAHLDPVDAQLAKGRLRIYVLALPAASLIGGWCALLQIAWFFSPDGIVDHIPETVRIGAFAVATAWLLGLIHAFRSLPKVIDEIMDRGIVSIDRPGADPGRSARQFRRLDLI